MGWDRADEGSIAQFCQNGIEGGEGARNKKSEEA